MPRRYGRRRRTKHVEVAQPPPRSHASQLLDDATQIRSSWGQPNALLEPEKFLEWNARLIKLYEDTRDAARAEGNEYVERIAEGWLPRLRETQEAVQRRLAEPVQQSLPGIKELEENAAPACGCAAPSPSPNPVDEALIHRARMLLGFMSTSDAIRHLVVEGVPSEDASLAVKAAAVMDAQDRQPQQNPLDENLAFAEEIQHGVGGQARVAEAEICDSRQCEVAHLLVRGDRVEFVSVEQVRRVGSHPLDERAMPSDLVLPKNYVLVHDATGTILTPCDLYAVKWRRSGGRNTQAIAPEDLSVAQEYFDGANLRMGSVEIPDGSWRRQARVKFIRYRRYGFANHFEHEYTPAVDLFYSPRPLAWKLQLPSGCVVDSRGFVVP